MYTKAPTKQSMVKKNYYYNLLFFYVWLFSQGLTGLHYKKVTEFCIGPNPDDYITKQGMTFNYY